MTVILQNLPYLLGGMLVTAQVTLFAIGVGVVIAIVTALARLSRVAPLRLVFSAYVEIMRNTPLLVQLFILWLGLPEFGVRLSPVHALAVGLAINAGAYMSEVVRGGLQSISKGQLEAAASIGLGATRTFLEILLPQALRTVYRAMGNQFISVCLASSLGTMIGADELTNRVLVINALSYQTVVLLVFLALVYFVVSYAIATAVRGAGWWLERPYR